MNLPSALHSELKSLKVEKGIISGKFKHLLKDSVEYAQQLELMKDISLRIKQLESALKDAEALTTTSQAPAASTTPVFPTLNQHRCWDNPFTLSVDNFAAVTDWPVFVAQHAYALPSHNPAWAEVIEQSFGHHSLLVCARDNQGKLLGGIPVTVFSSPLFGKFAVSMPYLNYGGIVCEYFDICLALIDKLRALRTELELRHIEIRSIYPNLGDNPSTKKASMILVLPANDTELDKMLGSKVRAQYKKADEFLPEYKIGKMELLEDFYRVFARNMRDLGTPVYAIQWFANILQHPGLNAALLIVYVKQKPVSCAFLVNHGKLMEIPWASTIQSANKYNANMWMYRKVLSFAINQGCHYFDFGRSTLDAGTFKFKKQWGAEPCQNYWYTLLPENAQKPELNPDNPKLKIFIMLWKWLPVWLTKIIGPTIIKGIP
ncbi:FemAB family XrtA/PEP-CTERM system-associated protein [Cellvibrio fibrivorans]|uniref:FemAB-related protein (PEP-CTERM system-associated) n=1 Tax=Cellvibrio fibrivorans TaxID=126350 RepID=A0ABU1UU23_9GAMM|nr:FemAB family XrtA/PEP-CTERM system-associated protein [Cellvibrio fibrivorans]MDR7088674.1 FemAB-related protein (PEP-CTERM system-associated) [Cellvibrio fibrivorans]